jgi:hypothetical protein
MSDLRLTALDDKWGWATEERYGDPLILHAEVAHLHAEGAIRG